MKHLPALTLLVLICVCSVVNARAADLPAPDFPSEQPPAQLPLSESEASREAVSIGLRPLKKKQVRRCFCNVGQVPGSINDTFDRGAGAVPMLESFGDFVDLEVEESSEQQSDSPEICRAIWKRCG